MSERMRPGLQIVRAGLLGAISCCGIAVVQGDESSAPLGLGDALDEGESLAPIIWPDGRGLPDGRGDASLGAVLYASHCASCHGGSGEGGSAPELVGDPASLDSEWPDRGIAPRWPVLAPLFDYLQRSMPPAAPGSLSDDDTWHLMAHLLVLNGLHDSQMPLTTDVLLDIQLPNQHRFIDVDGSK